MTAAISDTSEAPTPALHETLDLPRIVWCALEPSDAIILVLESRSGVLSIVVANEEAYRTSGYGVGQLVGQPLTALAGPQTDPAALDALLAAARDGRAHRTQLRCHDRAGQAFWFGAKLLPADEPGTSGRFVLIGRNITAKLRQEEQDHAAQGLLAKVFVTVDAPVYIIDLHGRFMMTNPAFDRLVGARPGSLVGTPSLERYAPTCHGAIAAKRTQQTQDGLDYAVDVTLLRLDGTPLTGRITGVMVQRADLLRFRIITVRVDPPASVATAAGRIELIGLQEVRQTLGVRWAALKDRAMATAEHVIRSRLSPHDMLSRTEDGGFVICFADASEAVAAARASSIGREVRQRLIGEGETPEVAHVFSAAATLPPGAAALSASDLAATVRRGIDARLQATMAAARAQLAEALANSAFETDAVHARERPDPVGCFVRLPTAVSRRWTVRPRCCPPPRPPG